MKKCYLIKDLDTGELVMSKNMFGVNSCRLDENIVPYNATFKVKICDRFIFFDKSKNILLKTYEDLDCNNKDCLAFIEKHDSESICEYYDRSKYEFIKVDVEEMELQGIRR